MAVAKASWLPWALDWDGGIYCWRGLAVLVQGQEQSFRYQRKAGTNSHFKGHIFPGHLSGFRAVSLAFLDNEVRGLFFLYFKLNKANLMHFETKLKTGVSAPDSAKVQASREYNVKDNPTLQPQLYRRWPGCTGSPLCLQEPVHAVCPSDERGYT